MAPLNFSPKEVHVPKRVPVSSPKGLGPRSMEEERRQVLRASLLQDFFNLIILLFPRMGKDDDLT
jgi:hypothetical protein